MDTLGLVSFQDHCRLKSVCEKSINQFKNASSQSGGRSVDRLINQSVCLSDSELYINYVGCGIYEY